MLSWSTGVEGFPVALADGQRENLSRSGDPGDTHDPVDRIVLLRSSIAGLAEARRSAAGTPGDPQRRRDAPGPGRPRGGPVRLIFTGSDHGGASSSLPVTGSALPTAHHRDRYHYPPSPKPGHRRTPPATAHANQDRIPKIPQPPLNWGNDFACHPASRVEQHRWPANGPRRSAAGAPGDPQRRRDAPAGEAPYADIPDIYRK